MDKFVSQLLWLFVGTYFFDAFTTAQDPQQRSLPITSRRRLPTVIITREHLRQMQNSYGTYGDTAAEFVVSAGLDTSKNSAVRIRRIGNRGSNNTHNATPNTNRISFPNTSNSGKIDQPTVRPEYQSRSPGFHNPNGGPKVVVVVNRRNHLNERDRNIQSLDRRHHVNENNYELGLPSRENIQHFNRNQAFGQQRPPYQYRPPIFVPYFQQNRRVDVGIPGESDRHMHIRPYNIAYNGNQRSDLSPQENKYPIVNVQFSTSSVSSRTQDGPRTSVSTSNTINQHRKPTLTFQNNNYQGDKQISPGKNGIDFRLAPQNIPHNFSKQNSAFYANNVDRYYIAANEQSLSYSKRNASKSDVAYRSSTSADRKNDKAGNDDNKTELSNATPVESSKKETMERHDLGEKLSNKTLTSPELSRNPVVESANPDKNILAETPALQLNSAKLQEFQTRIIRKPFLVLRDEITVNELPKKPGRLRFGPRSLEQPAETRETTSATRRKREAHLFDVVSSTKQRRNSVVNANASSNSDDGQKVDLFHSNDSKSDATFNVNLLNRRYNFGEIAAFGPQMELNLHSSQSNTIKGAKSTDYVNSREIFGYGPPFYENRYGYVNNNSSNGDVMSFSDFLASPLAEKLRLQRQMDEENGNDSISNVRVVSSTVKNAKYDPRSILNNNTIPYLRNLVAVRLLQSFLNLANLSANYSKVPKLEGKSPDNLTAEQRQFGIMLSPHNGHEVVKSKILAPGVKILRGRIISLKDLPSELIPIILGTYKPSSYVEQDELPYQDDPRITENILDNAIYTLLQNEELLNVPILKVPGSVYKANRKSPSTNHVGSLKTSEPVRKTSYSYNPEEWSQGPRCDRLTEEICLDDSDYPSSAIMSSIYKDKEKFDLMYAEIKERESQVEGLSRQQEVAFTFDHYYGPYPQMSATNMMPRDYGPNGGFVCPSEIHYAKPHRAKNKKGDWKVVVNVGEYTQTLRMEKCLSSGNPCKYVVNHMQSTCSQVYSYHRLLVFNKEHGLHIDVFRAPTACTCYLRPGVMDSNMPAPTAYMPRPNQYDEFGGHVETAPFPQALAESPNNINLQKKKNSFSNTLWAILGGGPQASHLAQQPNFLDEVQKHIMWTQQQKQYPLLLKQISPNQVLKQLLEEDEDDYNIRRQRFHQKAQLDQMLSGGFASHQVPIAVPLPPPPPPPRSPIHRRPVVSMAAVDKKNPFSSENFPKVIAVTPSEPTKLFGMPADINSDKHPSAATLIASQRPIYKIIGPQTFSSIHGFKIGPGMYPPRSENVQVHESSLLPIAPQFNSQTEGHLKPIIKPMPVPEGSNRKVVEDEDLIALEKSEEEDISYQTDKVTEHSSLPIDENDSKINFSYHPILEYLNM